MQKYDLEQSQTKYTPVDTWVSAFAKAGKALSSYLKGRQSNAELTASDRLIAERLQKAQILNPWFTETDLHFCLKNWSELLTEDSLKAWLSKYNLDKSSNRTIAVIPAGNIPLVGLHDILCILLSGNRALIKLSGSDDVLPRLIFELSDPDGQFSDSYHFTDERLEGYDAVIATGSDNTARYFHYYFKNKPSIIRHNRNSIAILTGEETEEQIEMLGDDIFRYFGLGCRSISHLVVPEDYDFDVFFRGIYKFKDLLDHQKYLNNYDYNKAVYLMSEFDLLDNGFLVLKKEEERFGSPIATLGYRTYTSTSEINNLIASEAEQLQCVAVADPASQEWNQLAGQTSSPSLVSFGQTQSPSLQDYPDGKDVMQFLAEL